MTPVCFDTETARIRPGLQSPPPVCIQWISPTTNAEIIHCVIEERRAYEWCRWLLESPDVLIVGHNVAYDLCVLMSRWPDLVPLVFDAYVNDRVTCTIVREKLHDIEHGVRRGRPYDMRSVAERRAISPLPDKEDPWRLRYWELRDVPVHLWPDEARRYALFDAWFTATIFAKQSHKPDEFRQARADLWLSLASAWGMRTDPEQVQRFYDATRHELEEERRQLQAIGLVRYDGSRDTTAAKTRMVACCRALGIDVHLTDTGQVSLSAEACEDSDDPFLQAYARYTSHGTILSRVKRLAHGVHTPIQPSFDSLAETGRTSCRQGDVKPGKEVTAWGFQTQNPNRKVGMRECFVAREGCVFIASDYDKCELCTVSQVNIWMHRELHLPETNVRLAQQLNDGKDPHLGLGAQILGISYDEAVRRKKDPDVKEKRQMAKPANFGFPGGLGIAAFMSFAKSQYGVVLTEAQARTLKDDWLAAFPEFDVYFRVVRSMLKSVGTNDDGTEKLRADIKHPMSDRKRGRVPFTVACNSFFQGLAADLAKDAGFRIAYECYRDPSSPLFGWRIVNFIHDEIIIEGPREQCHDAAVRMKEIMEAAGRKWCPDVPVKASPSVMYRWSKSAEDTIDPKTGRYIPYEEMPGYVPAYLGKVAA